MKVKANSHYREAEPLKIPVKTDIYGEANNITSSTFPLQIRCQPEEKFGFYVPTTRISKNLGEKKNWLHK